MGAQRGELSKRTLGSEEEAIRDDAPLCKVALAGHGLGTAKHVLPHTLKEP